MSSNDSDSAPESYAGRGNFTEELLPPPHHVPPTSNYNVILFIGLFMLAGIIFLAWIGRPAPVVTIGRALPQLDLQPLLEGTPPISPDYNELLGKITVLHFWGTWCPPCKKEFPEFTKLAAHFADNPDVAIVSVSSSGGPEYNLQTLHDETVEFMSAYGATMPTYSDPAAMTRQQIALILPNGSMGYPTTLVVDRDGKIFKLLDGYYPGDMEKLISVIEGKL